MSSPNRTDYRYQTLRQGDEHVWERCMGDQSPAQFAALCEGDLGGVYAGDPFSELDAYCDGYSMGEEERAAMHRVLATVVDPYGETAAPVADNPPVRITVSGGPRAYSESALESANGNPTVRITITEGPRAGKPTYEGPLSAAPVTALIPEGIVSARTTAEASNLQQVFSEILATYPRLVLTRPGAWQITVELVTDAQEVS